MGEEHILPADPIQQAGALQLEHHPRADAGQHHLAAVGLQNLVVAIQHGDHGAAKPVITAEQEDHHRFFGFFSRGQIFLKGFGGGVKQASIGVQDGHLVIGKLCGAGCSIGKAFFFDGTSSTSRRRLAW